MPCPKCGAQTNPGAKFCRACGSTIVPEAEPVTPSNWPAAPPSWPTPHLPASSLPAQAPSWPKPYVPPRPRAVPALVSAIVLLSLTVIAVIAILMALSADFSVASPDGRAYTHAAVEYSYQSAEPTPVFSFDTVDEIYPSLYRSLAYVAAFTGTCDYGEREVIVKLEIPGFTQAFEQKLLLTRQITKLRITPPLVTGELGLDSDKDAQIQYSVTDAETGKVLDTQSKNIKIYSKYDMLWWTDEYENAATDSILAWLTPESPAILALQRDASDYISDVTNGDLSGMYGYQDYGVFDNKYHNTWLQAVALQGALSDYANVRYIMSPFSVANPDAQRVKLPDDVISTKSGLCVETALVMASALQSAGMHAMLIFPPGHAQVAVEAWPGTGDYYLIETTMLPLEKNDESYYAACRFMEKERWTEYIDGAGDDSEGPCYVLDCDLGRKLGITPITN